MNICTLKMKISKNVKRYHFTSVSDAAIFEKEFLNHDDTTNVSFEVLYENLPESGSLINELARIPEKYADKEYHKYFGEDNEKKENIKN